MTKAISKSQIDRLGERLKKGKIEDDDLRLLDQYRRSYTEAYDAVVGAISGDLSLAPTGRPAKSTPSIVDKLRRESIRLTQIQDIAGCRIVVADIASQNASVQSLQGLCEDVIIVDRREKPSHGYRAVHVIVRYSEKTIEVQVRTKLQHQWAELSERLSDIFDPALKYGEGEENLRDGLLYLSQAVAIFEFFEAQPSTDFQKELSKIRRMFNEDFQQLIEDAELERGNNVISD